MQLTHKMFIHLFIPLKNQPPRKNSKWLVIKGGPSRGSYSSARSVKYCFAVKASPLFHRSGGLMDL